MFNYNPYDWYWLADDGRIFASLRQVIVDATDADYIAWAKGNATSPWPRDLEDNQTNAALQEVLAPYGLFADLTAYAADARWRKEVGGITISGIPIATDDRSKQMIMGARIAADADDTFTTSWDAGGTVVPLDAATIIAVSNAVLAHVNECFMIYATVQAGIAAHTITKTAQIDAAFGAV